jgi:hypothetical protein
MQWWERLGSFSSGYCGRMMKRDFEVSITNANASGVYACTDMCSATWQPSARDECRPFSSVIVASLTYSLDSGSTKLG